MSSDNQATEYLTHIGASLQRLDQDKLIQTLRPGRDPEDTREALAKVGLAASADLLALYAWHDGTDFTGVSISDICILPGYYFPPLAHAISDYRTFQEDERWSPQWFPILYSGGGDFYVVDLSQSGRSPVVHFMLDFPDQPVQYATLGDMLATIAGAFSNGIIFTEDNYLEMNDQIYGDFAGTLNPDIAWWRS